MAAGIVYHNMTTSSGVTFAVGGWVPNTAAPDALLLPTQVPINSSGTPLDTASGATSAATIRTVLATDSPGVTALGQAAMSASLPVVIASNQSSVPVTPAATESHLGQIGGTTVHLTNSPTVTATSYTTGMVVGGLISLTGAARVNSGSGLIQTVLVTVKTALTAPFDVFFFDTNPTNSTFTDNVNLAINVADLPFLCGIAHCTDLVTGLTPQILQANNLAMPFKLSAAATTLYAVIVMRGAESLASTSAIQLSVVILQD